jgi:two-component system OmpR family response regulator
VRVLVAEHDAGLRSVLERGLRRHGYAVDAAERGDDALHMMRVNEYAAVVLDRRLPGLEGIDVVRSARRAGVRTPVLMLTALDTHDDRIAGLDGGADDYMVKPFHFGELLARLRALLRRPAAGEGPILGRGRLTLDPATREVRAGERPLPVTPREFAMLELLLRRHPSVVSRESLATQVWEDDSVGWNTIEVHIARLRAKLVHAGVRVVAVRGIGYRLVDE